MQEARRGSVVVLMVLGLTLLMGVSTYLTSTLNQRSQTVSSRAAGNKCGENCDNKSKWIEDCKRLNPDKAGNCSDWYSGSCSGCDKEDEENNSGSGGGGNGQPQGGGNTTPFDPGKEHDNTDVQNLCGANPNDPRCCKINEWKNRPENGGANLPGCSGGGGGGGGGGNGQPQGGGNTTPFDPGKESANTDVQNLCGANPNDPRCCKINEWKNRPENNAGVRGNLPGCSGGGGGQQTPVGSGVCNPKCQAPKSQCVDGTCYDPVDVQLADITKKLIDLGTNLGTLGEQCRHDLKQPGVGQCDSGLECKNARCVPSTEGSTTCIQGWSYCTTTKGCMPVGQCPIGNTPASTYGCGENPQAPGCPKTPDEDPTCGGGGQDTCSGQKCDTGFGYFIGKCQSDQYRSAYKDCGEANKVCCPGSICTPSGYDCIDGKCRNANDYKYGCGGAGMKCCSSVLGGRPCTDDGYECIANKCRIGNADGYGNETASSRVREIERKSRPIQIVLNTNTAYRSCEIAQAVSGQDCTITFMTRDEYYRFLRGDR